MGRGSSDNQITLPAIITVSAASAAFRRIPPKRTRSIQLPDPTAATSASTRERTAESIVSSAVSCRIDLNSA
jgi:hypothetical protein